MKTREYRDYVEALRADYPELAEVFGRSDSIETVLEWMETRSFAPGSTDIIGQDEFNYDFLIRLEPEDKWLAFGVT